MYGCITKPDDNNRRLAPSGKKYLSSSKTTDLNVIKGVVSLKDSVKKPLYGENCFKCLTKNKFNEQNAVRFRQNIGILQTSAYSFYTEILK